MHMQPSLAKCPLFKQLSHKEIDARLKTITYTIQSYGKQEVLVSPNDASTHVGIIVSGHVEVSHLLITGQVLMVSHKGPNDLIAGPSVYSSNDSYGVTITAKTPCQLIRFEKQAFTALLQSDTTLLEAYLVYLSDQARYLRNRLYLMGLPCLCQKITYSLLEWIGPIHPYQGQEPVQVKLPYTKQSWAAYLGVTPQSLSRCLHHMAEKKMIRIEKRIIIIHHLETFMEVLNS